MATYNNLNALFTDIADAIRSKTGDTSPIVADNFPTAISNIPSGGSSSIYKFYTQDNQEITDITISGLANAYWYTKNGGEKKRVGGRIYHINSDIEEGTGDKFYVYDTEYTTDTYVWSKSGIMTGISNNKVGDSKSNTASITSQVTDGTLWTFIQSLNSSNHLGCND